MNNPGVLVGRLPEQSLEKIRQVVKATRGTTNLVNDRLVGVIEEEYETPYIPELYNFMEEMYDNYCRLFEIKKLKKYQIAPIWTNFMRRGEYNPLHRHGGEFSFVIWIQIPYEISEEFKNWKNKNKDEPPKNSCFEFVYSRLDGSITHETLALSTANEGDAVLFPNKLLHCVYPFQSSDDYRISIAGNIVPG